MPNHVHGILGLTTSESDPVETPRRGVSLAGPAGTTVTKTPHRGDRAETPQRGDRAETPQRGDQTETPQRGDQTETPQTRSPTHTVRRRLTEASLRGDWAPVAGCDHRPDEGGLHQAHPGRRVPWLRLATAFLRPRCPHRTRIGGHPQLHSRQPADLGDGPLSPRRT